MGAFKQGVDIQKSVSTATSGGTTSLVYNSAEIQIFTGTANHTVQLPDATTLVVGRKYEVNNRSTGTITVNDGGGGLLKTIAAGSQARFRVYSIGSVAGSWDSSSSSSGGGSGLSNSDYLSVTGAKAGSYSDVTRFIKVNPQEIGGNYWSTAASLPTAKAFCSAISLNGYLYAPGGDTSGAGASTNENVRYDNDNNYWLAKSNIIAAKDAASTSSFNGYGYLVAGESSSSNVSTCAKYTDSTDTWTAIATYGGGAIRQLGAFTLDSYLTATGGVNGGGTVQSSSYAYSDSANAWYQRASMSDARYTHGSFVLSGYGYALCGNNQGGSYIASDKYNTVSNSFSTIAATTVNHGNLSAWAANGLGYVAGGTGNITTVEEYRDASNAWMTKMPMATGRRNTGSENINGYGIIFGGSGTLSSVEKYRNFSSVFLGSIKRSKLVPTSILVTAKLNGLTVSVPIQARTEVNEWRTFTSNQDSALNSGQVAKTKFDCSRMLHRIGGQNGSNLNTVETYSDSTNVWRTRGNAPVALYVGAEWSINGLGYYAGGSQDATTYATATYSYDELSDTHVLKSGALPTGGYGMFGNTSNEGYGYAIAGRGTGLTYQNTNYQYNPTSDAYSTKATKPTAVWSAAQSALNGRIYSSGGENGSGYRSVHEQYDPNTNVWASKTGVGFNDGFPSAWSINGYYFLNGGSNGVAYVTTTQKYDDQANSWSSLSGTSRSPYGGMAGIYDGYGYSYGGLIISSGYYSTVERFNDAGNAWTSVASTGTGVVAAAITGSGAYRNYELRVLLPSFIAGLGASAWVVRGSLSEDRRATEGFTLEGRGFCSGNFNSGVSVSSTAEMFDEVSNSWKYVGSMATAAGYAGFGSLGGFGYITGGVTNTADTTFTAANQQLNPNSLAWTSKASMPTSRRTPAGMVINGYYYIASGYNGSNTGANEKYDAGADSWSTKTSATSRRNVAGMYYNGFGYSIAGGSPSGTVVERYNDVSDTWTTMNAFPASESNGTAAVTSDSKIIYVRGGATESYEYSPIMDTFIKKQAPAYTAGGSAPFTGTSGAYFGGGGTAITVTQQYVPSQNQVVGSIALKVIES